MNTGSDRFYRIGLVVVLSLALAGSVVIALEKNGALIHTLPNNVTAFPSSSVCMAGSTAIQIHSATPLPTGLVHVVGGFSNFTKSGVVKAAPWVGNFTVNFLQNMPDPDGAFPGMPFAPMLLNMPGNLTSPVHLMGHGMPTGNMLNAPFGMMQEYVVELDIPDVLLPSGPFWMEIFMSSLPLSKGACPIWHWASAVPSNVTHTLAISKTAPGEFWDPLRNQTLAIQIVAATGACCTDGPGTQSDCIETTRFDCETNHKLFMGEGTQCSPNVDCVMLLVEFDSVSVKATRDGVLLDWTTSVEIDTVGFRILRETAERSAKSLEYVSSIIPAAGAGLTGGSYSFLDNAKEAAGAVAYYIEDVDVYGRWTRHGPFAVDRTREAEPPARTRQAPRR